MRFLNFSLTTISILLLTISSQAVTPFSENFTATSLDTSQWSLFKERGNLTQSSGRLNYTTRNTTGETESFVVLGGIQPTYNENWEILLEVVNTSAKNTWIAIAVMNAADNTDNTGFELVSNKYIHGNYDTNGNKASDVVKAITATKVYLRIRFNKTDKVITHSYRTSTSAAWTKLSTFSTKGSTLTTRRGNWRMTNTSKFNVAIYAGGENSSVSSGQMFADNFKIRNY